MSDCFKDTAARVRVLRIVGALALATMAAACDKCGNFIPPIQFQAGEIDVCRDEAPRPR
jgi:hypothetical protein